MKKILSIYIIIFSFFVCVKNVDSVSDSSYILMDAESGRVLYEYNKDSRFLTASIAKIMTCIVAIEYGNLFDFYTVDYDTTTVEGSSIYLKYGDELLLYDLLCGLMLRSGNDAATLISKNVFNDDSEFVFYMNLMARKIGMSNSTFQNPTGLNTTTTNYSTAFDMALLMQYAMENEIFVDISTKKEYKSVTKNNTYYWHNKHKLVTGTDYVKSGKTGYTKISGRTLVSYAEIDNMKLIAVSFNESNDYILHDSLFNRAKNDFTKEKIIKKGVYKQELTGLDYYPYVKEDIFLLIKKDSTISVTFSLLNKPKSECGYISVFEDNKLIYKDNLYPYHILS